MGCDCNRAERAQRDNRSNYERKKAICAACPKINRWIKETATGEPLHYLDRCSECGCFIKLKARIWGQHCPLGNW